MLCMLYVCMSKYDLQLLFCLGKFREGFLVERNAGRPGENSIIAEDEEK